ncbi:MAG: hypothetical protein V4486_03730 [Patescibacteria group bacterium]
MSENYIEHAGKAVETDGSFKYVMAITLDPRTNYKEGIIRCISSREGELDVKGYVDRSVLYKITGTSLEKFNIEERLIINNEEKIIKELTPPAGDFIGLEDPDIWIDDNTILIHVYFTIPIKGEHTTTHLGHAFGKNLDSLEMTMPVLQAVRDDRAKEVSIAPLNKQGFRYNLIESSDKRGEVRYSTVRVAIAKDMGKNWEYGDVAFHPADNNISWIAGHASPGPLFSENFINLGPGKRLGLINGREANQKIGDKIKYGMFSVGLFIYDYENGKIDWVSPLPFIQDSEATTVTFASQFVETGPGQGILYAHVDDSFVRAYTLLAEKIKPLLPK